MPFSNFTNLDFDQIKTSIKDYLRANSTFSDFDFDGSNFSVLIDTLAYNTYINAFNSNMIVNESFLDSATLRENVVSLASNIGYTPRSRTAANAQVSVNLTITDNTAAVTLEPGIVCTGDIDNETYTFAITQPITTLTEIDPSDLRIDTYRASGAGGQHVNRTDSAVRITHEPSGIVVQCQSQRSQHQNKDFAMKQLRAKLYERKMDERRAEAQALEDSKADIGWGSQIRSYVLDSSRIKDLRTGVETSNTQSVLDGALDPFIEASLKQGL